MRFSSLFLMLTLFGSLCLPPMTATAQSIPEASKPVCAFCGASLPNGQHSSSCTYYVAPGGSSPGQTAAGGGHRPAKPDMNAVVGGMVMQGVLEAVLNPIQPANNSLDVISSQQKVDALKADQAAKARSANSASFRALQQQMRWTYKESDSPARSTADAPPGYKGLDDDLTDLAAQARTPFDTAGNSLNITMPTATPTPFFGDTMPVADLRLLVEPDNDPRIVDLREAETFVVQSLKNEQKPQKRKTALPTDFGRPILTDPSPAECTTLQAKLDRFLLQRQKFTKTVDLATTEIDVWQEQNQQALLNAAKEGVQYFIGNLLERIATRGEAADRLVRIYGKNRIKMTAEGIDVAELARRIQAVKRVSTAGELAGLANQGEAWGGFMKDGISALVSGLTADNAALEEMFADPRVAPYFETEMPALKAALDIARIAADAKVFGKWVARKMPVIAGCEFAVNQSYNAFDWALSLKNLLQAHRINGEVLASAQSLQRHIDQTRFELATCD